MISEAISVLCSANQFNVSGDLEMQVIFFNYYSNSILIQKCLFPPTYNILHAVNKVLYSIDSDIDYHDSNRKLSHHSCTVAVETVSV